MWHGFYVLIHFIVGVRYVYMYIYVYIYISVCKCVMSDIMLICVMCNKSHPD